MKKQLSFALLTVSIFSLNILPVKAIGIADLEISDAQAEFGALANGQWCVEIPYMGVFCWDL
ncbi:hypothetical protein [Pleurocapsa sp. FMAR1]|uniref:hypothetical protein n=1 Tax=Pleurocapsa sp. FMAR1 TaxID=3040204 RepID=UPI0029C7DA73|nr:hypothetical protein [Pleurocapsa sp. FMAR1]